MKKVWTVVFIIIIVCLLGLCLIKKDTKNSVYTIDTSSVQDNPLAVEIDGNYPMPKTFTVDGVDYLQSQAPVGKFGGRFVTSTIGEGPKTFNPFTSTDATSSAMAEMMYDGLFSSNPMDGKVVPKLAKSVEIKGNNYIVHLRKGLKWTDGKPIKAEEVMFN